MTKNLFSAVGDTESTTEAAAKLFQFMSYKARQIRDIAQRNPGDDYEPVIATNLGTA